MIVLQKEKIYADFKSIIEMARSFGTVQSTVYSMVGKTRIHPNSQKYQLFLKLLEKGYVVEEEEGLYFDTSDVPCDAFRDFSSTPIRVSIDFLTIASLTSNEKIVLGAIESWTASDGWCYLSDAYIADRLLATEYSISKAISRLDKKGFLVRRKSVKKDSMRQMKVII